MKLKLDENLPESLIARLTQAGHDVDNVRLENLTGGSDSTVWHAAQEAGRFLITQDLDFSDLRRFAPGTHCGLMLVRMREPGLHALTLRITEAFTAHEVARWHGAFVLLTDTKLRVRFPA